MPVNSTNQDLGWKAPKFNLLNVNNNKLTLDEIKGANGTVIAFICNHCPYVISIVKRLKFESDELKKHSINTIAIMSNDVNHYPDDSFENMKLFANKYQFNFPYLYDESQEVANNYKAVCTPDIYGFNSELILQYRGRIDSAVIKNNNKNDKIERELYNAMIDIKDKGFTNLKQFNSFGCSIKWK
ncbi:MAG: thioredoxin family protein [Pelagibacteraceae bacterium]|nr:thioredoxin family protein [Pelagibacteraceae bacterium]|tara:strand:- start:7473 stop:8027 length:555 start_codon:yes stop_codon:yes gene_type:complete